MPSGRPATTCSARARTTGQRCKRAPAPGARVCVKHGGAAPQVREAGRRRLAAAEVRGLMDVAVRDLQARRLDLAPGASALPPLTDTLADVAETLRSIAAGLDAGAARKIREQAATLDELCAVPS